MPSSASTLPEMSADSNIAFPYPSMRFPPPPPPPLQPNLTQPSTPKYSHLSIITQRHHPRVTCLGWVLRPISSIVPPRSGLVLVSLALTNLSFFTSNLPHDLTKREASAHFCIGHLMILSILNKMAKRDYYLFQEFEQLAPRLGELLEAVTIWW